MMNQRLPAPFPTRRGLTLVELLVVLTILALMATVAITSTDLIMSQGRYEATVRSLTNIEEAVRGPSGVRQPDGTLLVSGFVADIGRLPIAYGDDPRLQLAELWANDKDGDGVPDLPTFDIRWPDSDPEVLVPCGWRGPYLRLPLGTADVRDGWGNPLVLLNDAGDVATMGESIHRVGSLGADYALEGTGYDADFDVSLADNVEIAISGRVYELDDQGQRQKPTADVTVRLYWFNPTAQSELEAIEVTESLLVANPDPPPNPVPQSLTFSILTAAGPRYLRAYMGAKKSNIVRIQRSDVIELDLVP
jgi:prepilin-type N-terminal cleavage/methylation domain-containing protein